MNVFYKSILIMCYSTYAFASDSYMRGIMAYSYIESIDESVLLFSTVKGEKLSSISQNLYAELDLSYSTDFSFDVLEIGLYSAYLFPILDSPFTLISRLGINYEKLDINGITMEDTHEEIEGFFLSYGLGLQYSLFESNNLYIDITEKGNSQSISYGIQYFF